VIMTGEVRTARADDLDHIVLWASETFEWGDYVPERFPAWLGDPEGVVLVVPDDADRPIALCHAVMLSAYEGWLEAARVHPNHRRSGLGTTLNHAGARWLADRGARVVRLAVEARNETAHGQVEKLGYRSICVWQHGGLVVEPTRRGPPAYRLRPGSPAEVDAAWVFWAGSDLAAEGRELIPHGWQWRRARPEDLVAAAKHGHFYQSPAGWVAVRQPDAGRLQTTFLATVTEDAPRLLDGLHDLGLDVGAEEVRVKMPGTPWAAEALTRAGADPREIVIYARASGQ
jgi:GNAT superfamily N-acetyltransferase